MTTVARGKAAAERLAELEHRLAFAMHECRQGAADARVAQTIYERTAQPDLAGMQLGLALGYESALHHLIDGDDYTIRRKRLDDWVSLDFGPALERYIARRRRWLDPERDYDMPPHQIAETRKALAAAEALRAERDRAEAEALAAS